MKGLHGGIPIAVLAAVARAQVDVIGGSNGLDSGNAGGVITENDFGRATTEVNKDDHHLDVNTKTKVDVDVDAYPDPYWHHWRPVGHPHWRKARGDGGDTVIGGPSGIDTGNDASAPTENEFESDVNEANIDDHSDHYKGKTDVDVDKSRGHWKRDPGHHHPPATLIDGPGGIDSGNSASLPTTNEFTSFYKEHNQDDHSADIDQKFDYDQHNHAYPVPVPGHPYHWKRDHGHRDPPATVIDGPGGIDSGNSASLPTTNEFASFYKEHNQDDHSADIDQKFDYDQHNHVYPVPVPVHPYHWKRGHSHPPATVIDGPGGIDTGNSASLPTDNEFASFYQEHNQDDHSADIDQKFDYDQHNHVYPVPVPGHPHHWKARKDGDTVIDGPGGVDTGSSAAIPTKNEWEAGYSETNIDDHSVDIDHKTDVDIDNHWAYPYPYPVPVHPHHWKARKDGDTVIDGPGGVDSGNSAAIPTKNEFAAGYSETNIDDHSVDIDQKFDYDQHTHYPYPYPVPVPGHPHPHWPHHLKARQHGNTVIDGSGGVDRGSDAAIPTKNDAGFAYSEYNKDDHSVDIDTKTDVDIDTDFYPVPYPVHYHPHPHHFHGRGLKDTTVIDGPGGIDTGNDFSAPTENEFTSIYDEVNKDDHSFTGKAAADVDIDNHHPYPVPVPAWPHHWKARSDHHEPSWKDVTLIDGPGGIDTGNDADLSTTNTFLSDYDEFNKDDHSFTGKAAADVDVDNHYPYPVPVPGFPHHWKARGHHEPPVTVIGGPNGIDTGNSADLSTENTAITDYDEFNGDDHSLDWKAKADYDIDYRRSLHARAGTDLIDGPGGIDTGNSVSAPTTNHVAAGYSEYNEDDHSVDVDSKTDVDIDSHAHPVFVPHPVPVPHHHVHPGPGPFHEPPAAPAPESHSPQEAPHADPAPVNVPSAEEHVPQEAPHAQHAPEPVVEHSPQGEETHQAPPSGDYHAPVPQSNPQPESPAPAVHSQPAPAAPNSQSDHSEPIVHSAPAAPAPSAPSVNENNYQPAPSAPVAHVAQTQPAPVYHGMATPSSSVAHVALTSTVMVPQSSSFAKIPIYVPQSSAAASAVHAPASSTVVVHPTGVAASTPSAASSAAIASRADAVFTGGVAHLTPHAGVFSVVCGVAALLAFVL